MHSGSPVYTNGPLVPYEQSKKRAASPSSHTTENGKVEAKPMNSTETVTVKHKRSRQGASASVETNVYDDTSIVEEPASDGESDHSEDDFSIHPSEADSSDANSEDLEKATNPGRILKPGGEHASNLARSFGVKQNPTTKQGQLSKALVKDKLDAALFVLFHIELNDKAYKTRVVNNANAPEQDMVVRSSEAWTFKRVCESAADALNQALISNAITNPAPNVTGRQLAAMYRNMEQRVFSDGFLENVEDSGPEDFDHKYTRLAEEAGGMDAFAQAYYRGKFPSATDVRRMQLIAFLIIRITRRRERFDQAGKEQKERRALHKQVRDQEAGLVRLGRLSAAEEEKKRKREQAKATMGARLAVDSTAMKPVVTASGPPRHRGPLAAVVKAIQGATSSTDSDADNDNPINAHQEGLLARGLRLSRTRRKVVERMSREAAAIADVVHVALSDMSREQEKLYNAQQKAYEAQQETNHLLRLLLASQGVALPPMTTASTTTTTTTTSQPSGTPDESHDDVEDDDGDYTNFDDGDSHGEHA